MNYDLLPSGASPSWNIKTLNPHEKYSSKKDLNGQERKAFQCICTLSYRQIVECYANIDKDMTREEFCARCSDCPYADKTAKRASAISSNKFPFFIDDIVETDVDNPSCYVYYITDGEYIKIGVAENVKKRLSHIQTGNPRPLSVICAIPVPCKSDAYALESRLHNEYAMFARCGEWFDIFNHIDRKAFSSAFPYNIDQEVTT